MKILIVCNGPSLEYTPLDKLEYNLSIGMNRIHLLYNSVKWRPDVYVYGDRSGGNTEIEDVSFHLDQGYECYIRADIGTRGEFIGLKKPLWDYENYHPFVECSHGIYQINGPPAGGWHPPHPCKWGGTASVAIQLAALNYNATEIFLVGADLGYEAQKVKNFSPVYHAQDKYSEKQASNQNTTVTIGHKISKEQCEQRGIKIYNATIGGELEVYERKSVAEYAKPEFKADVENYLRKLEIPT